MDDTQVNQVVAENEDESKHLSPLPVDWKSDGYDHYLDWYFEKWPNKANPAKQREMEWYLKEKGFLN